MSHWMFSSCWRACLSWWTRASGSCKNWSSRWGLLVVNFFWIFSLPSAVWISLVLWIKRLWFFGTCDILGYYRLIRAWRWKRIRHQIILTFVMYCLLANNLRNFIYAYIWHLMSSRIQDALRKKASEAVRYSGRKRMQTKIASMKGITK